MKRAIGIAALALAGCIGKPGPVDGDPVTIGVTDSARVCGAALSYRGMPSKDTFALKTIGSYDRSPSMYFPADGKDITVHGLTIKVLDVDPRHVTLKCTFGWPD